MRWEQTTRIEDLTGWINVRDYPSEIENKQFQDLVNFNFEWNKLVSSKGKEVKQVTSSPLQAIKIDSNDLWYIEDSKLYKSWTEVPELQWSTITFSTLSTYWQQYEPNLYTYIVIDWVEYEVNWATPEERKNSLVNQLDTNVYDVREKSVQEIFIGRFDFIAPVISLPSYSSYILWVDAPWATWLDRTWTEIFSDNKLNWTCIVINWTPVAWLIQPNTSWTLRSNANTLFSTMSFPSENNAVQYYFDNDVDLNIWDSSTSQSIGWLLNKVDTLNYISNYSEEYRGIYCLNTTTSFSVTFDWYTISWTIPAWNIASIRTQIDTQLPSWYYTEYTAVSSWFLYPDSAPWAFFIYSSNWVATISSFQLNWLNSASYIVYNKWYITTPKTLTQGEQIVISWQATWISFDWIVDVTIGNQMQLLVSRDDWGAAVFVDNIYNPIWEEAVWLPTVWTIYNWKIVLWGYPDNDNIVFSKTSTPDNPLLITSFDWYDAWGQSVSGWDKGRVVGMTTSENWLYVFKDNSIWYTNSEKDNPDSNSFNFIFRKITSSWAYSQSTITDVEQDVFYLDWNERAVRRLSYEQNLTTLRDTAISDEIRGLLEDLPQDQSLATANYTYPNYRLYLSDHTWPTITYPNGKTYNTNNVCLTYNVYNKSWTKETLWNVIVADKGYIGTNDNNISELEKGNINLNGLALTKRYTEGDDFIRKKYNRVKVLGKLKPEYWESLSFTTEILNNNWEVVKRVTQTATTEERIDERIHTYFLSESVEFRFSFSGKGRVEIYDLFYSYKATKI